MDATTAAGSVSLAAVFDDHAADRSTAYDQRPRRTPLPRRQVVGNRMDLGDGFAVTQHADDFARLDQVEEVLRLVAQLGEGGFAQVHFLSHECTFDCTLCAAQRRDPTVGQCRAGFEPDYCRVRAEIAVDAPA